MKEGIYMKQKTGLQMSSSLPVMILLNLSGGTQDACSYFLRDHVFANAQTGNIVLMGCYLISEDLRNSIRYFLPVAFFALPERIKNDGLLRIVDSNAGIFNKNQNLRILNFISAFYKTCSGKFQGVIHQF